MKGKGEMNACDTGGTCPEAAGLAGWQADRPLREIAVELHGREQVDARWHADSPMRARMRLLLLRARVRAGAETDAEHEANTEPELP